MSYSTQQLKQIAKTDPQELVKIINNNYRTDSKTIALAIDVLGEEISDETIVVPLVKKLLRHAHMLIRESAIMCAANFYDGKELPQDIIDRLKVLSKTDPSNIIKDLATDTLKDFKIN
jgi:vesicle coat complex subunit